MRGEPRPVYGYGLESWDVAALWVLPRWARRVLALTEASAAVVLGGPIALSVGAITASDTSDERG